MTLDQLPPRRRAEIVAIEWDRLAPDEAKRLRALGIDEGARVAIAHRGVFGGRDPIALLIGRMTLAVRSGGADCASGIAELPAVAGSLPEVAGYRAASPPAARPPASAESLAEGVWLGMAPLHVTGEVARAYLADLGETGPLYAEQGLLHPGMILRTCNWALTHSVALGPWIHVGSRIRHLAAGLVGETLSVRARVAANYQRKGHGFVELDALVVAGSRPLAQIVHTAIWRPRQLAE